MTPSNGHSLFVFIHLDGKFVPTGKLELIEQEGLSASTFAYGQHYLNRPNATEIDPVGLTLRDKESIRDTLLAPLMDYPFGGGIRDAAPDAWGRRVIEAYRKT